MKKDTGVLKRKGGKRVGGGGAAWVEKAKMVRPSSSKWKRATQRKGVSWGGGTERKCSTTMRRGQLVKIGY